MPVSPSPDPSPPLEGLRPEHRPATRLRELAGAVGADYTIVVPEDFDGTAEPGELVDVEIAAATSTTLSGHERLVSSVG